jgi:hypothetical protein
MNTSTLTIRLPKEQREALKRWAKALKRTESEYIRGCAGADLSDVLAGGGHAPPMTEGRCIPRVQLYRMSAQTHRLLVWRSIRCDALGRQASLLPQKLAHFREMGSRRSFAGWLVGNLVIAHNLYTRRVQVF